MFLACPCNVQQADEDSTHSYEYTYSCEYTYSYEHTDSYEYTYSVVLVLMRVFVARSSVRSEVYRVVSHGAQLDRSMGRHVLSSVWTATV